MSEKVYPKDYSFKLVYSDGSEKDELPEFVQRALNDWIDDTYAEEICCECGEPVVLGSGKFVNRIPEMSGILARVDGNRPHPTGQWVCAECDSLLDEIPSPEAEVVEE